MVGEQMDPILLIATIIDTIDGKVKTGKSYDQIFTEILGEKHEGEFDKDLVQAYRSYITGRQPALRADVPLALRHVS